MSEPLLKKKLAFDWISFFPIAAGGAYFGYKFVGWPLEIEIPLSIAVGIVMCVHEQARDLDPFRFE